MERLLQELGGVLRLAAVTFQALLRCAATALSSFRLLFDGSCGAGHGVLLCGVGVFDGCSLSKQR